MPTLEKNIVLLGFRGVGKTTLGKYLAKKYSIEFLDADILLEQKLEETLISYTQREGIESFREKEFQQLQEIFLKKEKNKKIISLGGGIVEHKESYQLLKSVPSAKKILLEMDIEKLWDRLKSFTAKEERVSKIKNKEEFVHLWKKRGYLFKKIAEEIIFLRALGKNSIQKNAQSIERHLIANLL